MISSSSSGTASSSGTGGGGGGGAPVGTCAKGCAVAADCCPAGAPMTCPNSYPLKLACAGGICGVGECVDDAECKMFFSKGHVCAPIAGKKSCVLACTMGGNECSAPSTCAGTADNGAIYCKADPKPFVCTMDTDCKGYGKCIGGSCVCTADGDCTNAAVDKCVIP